jgi:putative ABC transport system permease protein
VGRLAWSQLRFRAGRSVALLLGISLAATAFTVLTAAARTLQLQTVGTVSANFRPAYDILVRPRGSRTALEDRTGTVQPNFLSGIYGGISLAQYHQIQQVPGVQVAAPIAMVGYAQLRLLVPVALPAADNSRPGRQLYRYTTTWVSAGGTTRIVQPPSYLYVTPNRLAGQSDGSVSELLPGGSSVSACPSTTPYQPVNPFSSASQSHGLCWSKIDGWAGMFGFGPRHTAFATVTGSLPVLIAAIDPAAEARLDRLDGAVLSGQYLKNTEGDGLDSAANGQPTIPALAAVSSGVGEYSITRIQRLQAPTAPVSLTTSVMAREAAAPGPAIGTVKITAQQVYQQALLLMRSPDTYMPIGGYWTAGPTSYRRGAGGILTPVQVRNPLSVWQSPTMGPPPMDEIDNQYRALQSHMATGSEPLVHLVGTFDPSKIPAFDPLNRVPLGPYQPTTASPANAATRRALGGDLLPSLNLGGYVSQPVDLITTLAALPALNKDTFTGNLHAADPISVIRVRVGGVSGPDALSLERIKVVAQQIAQRTGLQVDIVAGSSPEPTAIGLPPGRFGQPALQLTEGWVKKGVAVTVITAVDKQSVMLFMLVLVVCVLFVANSAAAAIRGRRHELGVLACLGWARPRLFATVLGELAALGVTAGLLSAAAALPLAAALRLHASPGQALLAVPVAMAVAVIAGTVPAGLAARADPLASVRPPELAVRHAHHPRGITALAVANVSRSPGRTLAGALSLAVGIAALSVLIAVTTAFRGVVVGTLLGSAIGLQVRAIDYVAAAATVALGVLAVGDVVFLNIKERAAELATIRSFGWPESALVRLVVTEGVLIGIAGSLTGAAAGVALAAQLAGQLPVRLLAAAAAVVAVGVLVTAATAVLPAQLLRHLPAAHLLAEE